MASTKGLSIALALLLCCAAGVTRAQPAGNAAAEGKRLAQQYCATCHVVAPSTQGGWTDAPSFQSIAQRPEATVTRLSGFIQKGHLDMMNDQRPKPEADALAAYIVSLRRH